MKTQPRWFVLVSVRNEEARIRFSKSEMEKSGDETDNPPTQGVSPSKDNVSPEASSSQTLNTVEHASNKQLRDDIQSIEICSELQHVLEKEELNIILEREEISVESGTDTIWTQSPDSANPLLTQEYLLYRCDDKQYRVTYTNNGSAAAENTSKNSGSFVCHMNGCGREFTTQGYLRVHQLVHDCQKALTCNFEGCNRSFSWPAHLKYHKLSHTGKRPFRCEHPGCGKDFYTGQRLTIHRRMHNGEKPFVCEVEGCSKAFTTAGNLKNHARIHTGDKPYSCDTEGCGKSFTELSSLKKHKVVHSGNKPFLCDICGQRFTQSASRNVHMKKSHRTSEPTNMTTPLTDDTPAPSYIVITNSEGKIVYSSQDVIELRTDPPLASTSTNVVVLSEPQEMAPIATSYHGDTDNIQEK